MSAEHPLQNIRGCRERVAIGRVERGEIPGERRDAAPPSFVQEPGTFRRRVQPHDAAVLLVVFAPEEAVALHADHEPSGTAVLPLLVSIRMLVPAGRLPFQLSVVELDPAQAVQRDGYRVAAVPVQHGAREAYGYALVEDERAGEFDPGAAERLGVSPGPDFGRLQRGHPVDGVSPEQVMGPPRQGRKIVLSGDTAPCEALAVAAHEADVLVHEATFSDEEADRARETFHSTARQAAELARGAQARMLALTHISSRYAGSEVREEARAAFAATEAPRDFDTIEVPFPERGPAALIRWSGRGARPGAEPGEAEPPAAGEPAAAGTISSP